LSSSGATSCTPDRMDFRCREGPDQIAESRVARPSVIAMLVVHMFAENAFPSTIAQTRQRKVQFFWIDAATWCDYGYLSGWFEHLGYLKDFGIVGANVGNGSHTPDRRAASFPETAALPGSSDAAFRYRFPDLNKL
jgi:hypothetical protein